MTVLHPAKLYLYLPFNLPSVLPVWRQMNVMDKMNLLLVQLLCCIGIVSMPFGFSLQLTGTVASYYLLVLTSLAFPVMFTNPDNERLAYRYSTFIIDAVLVLHCYLMMVTLSIFMAYPLHYLLGMPISEQANLLCVLFIGMAAMSSMQYAESYSNKIGPSVVVAFTLLSMISMLGLLSWAFSR